jgi:CheY-specific phosphatase CheX
MLLPIHRFEGELWQALAMDKIGATAVTDLTGTRNWEELLIQGAQEVFEMMIGIPLRRRADNEQAPGKLTAVIGLAGPLTGVFAIRCDEKTAIGITRGMLGVDESEARSEMWDAMGEVCNMVVGNFKGKVGAAGELSVLSVPSVIHGHDYRVRPLINGSCVECCLETADGVLRCRLDYRLM